jgi:hypothetical protein
MQCEFKSAATRGGRILTTEQIFIIEKVFREKGESKY